MKEGFSELAFLLQLVLSDELILFCQLRLLTLLSLKGKAKINLALIRRSARGARQVALGKWDRFLQLDLLTRQSKTNHSFDTWITCSYEKPIHEQGLEEVVVVRSAFSPFDKGDDRGVLRKPGSYSNSFRRIIFIITVCIYQGIVFLLPRWLA